MIQSTGPYLGACMRQEEVKASCKRSDDYQGRDSYATELHLRAVTVRLLPSKMNYLLHNDPTFFHAHTNIYSMNRS